jgi:hypothetical protein
VISAFMNHVGPRISAGGLLLSLLALCSSGCGPSGEDISKGEQGTAKAKPAEELYRYEGEGAAKVKTRIRRKEERLKELQEAVKKPG